ncbi:MAG: ABC transporter permease [Defluviitaleaceae bacterium]|nr:ABC transporter permease [Defluviitaleaceae bacterium]
MWKALVRRFLIFIPQIIGVTIVIFILAEFMPGDALSGLYMDPTLDPIAIEAMREAHGLNDPWNVRYVRWVTNMLQGDFGMSIQWHRPVLEVVGERIGNTIFLSLLTVIIVYIFAIPVGLIAGRYKGKMAEKAISVYNFIQLSIPLVVFAVMLQWVFAILLIWFPLRGSVSVDAVGGGFFEVFLSRLHHAMLPALSMALLSGVGVIQFLANEINDQRSTDYPLTARSKGVPIGKVYTRHIFRNSILPIVAGVGGIIVGLFGGAVIIETLFTFFGMGQLFVASIAIQDWPVANFLIVFYASLSMIGFLISDIALTIFDPRIRIK